MLFNSYTFILLFLPVTVAVFFLLGRFGRVRDSIAWLVVASLFFYGFWNPIYLLLIIGSIAFNYGLRSPHLTVRPAALRRRRATSCS